LEIGRYLHPSEYAKQFPRVAHVFDALRNGKIETYNSKIEQLIAQKEVHVLLQHLNKKPGVFARRLHEVLRRFPEQLEVILFAFEEKIDQVALKNLLVLDNYFDTINEAACRTIINKKGKMKVLNNNAFGALTDLELNKIITVIKTAIHNQLAQRENWREEKIWIDERLTDYTVPLQQRKAMDGLLTVGRGTRVEIDLSKVLRLFVYWKQSTKRTDLDLSVIQYDTNFNYVGHVSYTNLKDGGICHSGDLQNAPKGAAEFVDITMNALKSNVKYLAVQINRYAGETFAEMTAHAGWMWREQATSEYKTFDIKTVANKFDLNGVGGYAIPLIVDIERQHIISTDLYVSSKQLRNNVEGTFSEVALMCRELAQFTVTRPVMKDLAMTHAWAREGELVANKEEATITFGVENCTYNTLEIEKVLTELL
jgi:stress response protein SCP2